MPLVVFKPAIPASERPQKFASLFDNNWIQPFSQSGHSRQNNVLQDILTRHIQAFDGVTAAISCFIALLYR